MNEDSQKELELLQEQFLKNDEWFEQELESAKRMIGQMPEKPRTTAHDNKPVSSAAPKAVPVYNTTVGPSREELVFDNSQTEEAPMPRKGTGRLWALIGLEVLGIAGVAAYWLLFILR